MTGGGGQGHRPATGGGNCPTHSCQILGMRGENRRETRSFFTHLTTMGWKREAGRDSSKLTFFPVNPMSGGDDVPGGVCGGRKLSGYKLVKYSGGGKITGSERS